MPTTSDGTRATTIAIVSPGAMGSALGRCWVAGGHRVVATVAGRSRRTHALAAEGGLELLPDLDTVVAKAAVVVSICPPGEAEAVLAAIVASATRTGSSPLLVEANAVSPGTVTALAGRAAASGLALVDAAVSGGPPAPGDVVPGATTLYVSGPRAAEVAHLARDGFVTRVVGDEAGLASAVKMCTASVYKGTTALWLRALQTAHVLGVTEAVLDDLGRSDPGRAGSAARSLAVAAAKSGRFVAEMEQIAQTQADAGSDPGLFTAMARLYAAVSATPLAHLSPEVAHAQDDLAAVLDALSSPTSPPAHPS